MSGERAKALISNDTISSLLIIVVVSLMLSFIVIVVSCSETNFSKVSTDCSTAQAGTEGL